MSYTVLARKYRPQKFADVIGQDHVVRTLKNALEQKRIAHGYIFSGHRGIGKTTIARILAMALNCQSSDSPVAEPCGVCDSCREIREGSVGTMDVIEIDAATNRGIEEVRGLIATATSEPARDRYRIFILDEAHQVTDAAFNALLKTLEEPPPWVVFMMATTQPEDIPQTIRSRCQHFSFHAVRFEEIVNHIREIATTEGLTVDEDALALLAEAGDGSMRDALSIMDQAISCCGNTLTADVVRGLVGTVSTEVLERVMNAVHENSSDEVLRIVDKLMVEGQSATHFARQTVRFLRNALVAKVAGIESPILQISSDEKKRVSAIAGQFGEEELTRFLQIMLRTHGDVSYKQEQRFHLELGLLKMVHAQRLLPLEQLLSSVSLADATPRPATGVAAAAPRQAAHSGTSQNTQQSTPRTAVTPPAFTSRPAGVPPMGGGGSPFGQPSGKPSPFEADKARKEREDLSAGTETPALAQAPVTQAGQPAPFGGRPAVPGMQTGSAPFGTPFSSPFSTPQDCGSALAVAPQIESAKATADARDTTGNSIYSPIHSPAALDVDALRDAVLQAMEAGGSQMLVHALEDGQWSGEGNLLSIQVGMSESMIELSYTREQEKLANLAASRVAGRAIKVRLVGGATSAATVKPRLSSAGVAASGSIKTRAAEEPVVKRMMEKFGAEIRIVMDRSER
jgi:DNA polymerase-3 subunit gamma/tau